MKTVAQLARTTDPALVRAYGAIRRFVITLTDAVLWQIVGVRMPDEEEVLNAEVFTGIGFAARPPDGVEAEAIVAMVGDANNPIIVGVRDEQTRAASVSDIQPDETAAYNSKVRLYCKADGTIEARSHSGTAVALATKADLDALRDAIIGWTPAPNDGGAALKTALSSLFGATAPYDWPTGTTKLRGE